MKVTIPHSQLSVDDIIERVLIRNTHQNYDYTQRNNLQSTSEEHLWHFQLQEENVELKQKLKTLRTKIKKKTFTQQKQTQLQRQVEELKTELEKTISNNAELQNQINRMRLKNTQMNQTVRQSLDDSQGKRKSMRECVCPGHQPHKNSPSSNNPKRQTKIKTIESPIKPNLKTTKEVSISCCFETTFQHQEQITKKKQYILSLKNIVSNQQELITAYQRELAENFSKQILEKKNTMASTHRFQPIQRPTSQTTFKPLSSVGSIVKMRRK